MQVMQCMSPVINLLGDTETLGRAYSTVGKCRFAPNLATDAWIVSDPDLGRILIKRTAIAERPLSEAKRKTFAHFETYRV
jgi:hypothetical protein